MSERKVLNKYYPPDFDPSKIPRLRLPKERQYTVRLMAPCNMRCKTCGEYIYKGKKFNARKETVQNEEYLGLKIYRFYIKCPRCLAEITFKTDPENADYIVEHGATRNFQALKLAEEAAEKEAKEKEEEEKNNPMKLLENRTKMSKREMESLEALEEIKELNQKHAKVDFEHLLQQNYDKLVDVQKMQEEEDEEFIRATFLTADGEKVKRLYDENEEMEVKINYENIFKGKAPTDVLCDDITDMNKNSAKKQKLSNSDSMSSRQKSIEMLRKAVKMKKSTDVSSGSLESSPKKPNNSQSASGRAQLPENSTDIKIEKKSSGLSLLCNYSGSESD